MSKELYAERARLRARLREIEVELDHVEASLYAPTIQAMNEQVSELRKVEAAIYDAVAEIAELSEAQANEEGTGDEFPW